MFSFSEGDYYVRVEDSALTSSGVVAAARPCGDTCNNSHDFPVVHFYHDRWDENKYWFHDNVSLDKQVGTKQYRRDIALSGTVVDDGSGNYYLSALYSSYFEPKETDQPGRSFGKSLEFNGVLGINESDGSLVFGKKDTAQAGVGAGGGYTYVAPKITVYKVDGTQPK